MKLITYKNIFENYNNQLDINNFYKNIEEYPIKYFLHLFYKKYLEKFGFNQNFIFCIDNNWLHGKNLLTNEIITNILNIDNINKLSFNLIDSYITWLKSVIKYNYRKRNKFYINRFIRNIKDKNISFEIKSREVKNISENWSIETDWDFHILIKDLFQKKNYIELNDIEKKHCYNLLLDLELFYINVKLNNLDRFKKYHFNFYSKSNSSWFYKNKTEEEIKIEKEKEEKRLNFFLNDSLKYLTELKNELTNFKENWKTNIKYQKNYYFKKNEKLKNNIIDYLDVIDDSEFCKNWYFKNIKSWENDNFKIYKKDWISVMWFVVDSIEWMNESLKKSIEMQNKNLENVPDKKERIEIFDKHNKEYKENIERSMKKLWKNKYKLYRYKKQFTYIILKKNSFSDLNKCIREYLIKKYDLKKFNISFKISFCDYSTELM